jgi:RNA polymerase sigma-B factor
LFRRCRRDNDLAAREAIVVRYLPLARRLARRYARSSEPFDDLVQVASLALVKAIDRFDPDRGNGFPAFAIPTIVGELRRYFRDCAWSVHVPRGAQERALTVQAASDRLTNGTGRAPSVHELAEYLEATPEEVMEGLSAVQAYDTVSLDTPCEASGSEACTIGDTFGEEDPRYELIEDDIVVTEAVHTLPDRERRIMRLRFCEGMTQSEIGALEGVSQMQISRLLRRSIDRLREYSGVVEA